MADEERFEAIVRNGLDVRASERTYERMRERVLAAHGPSDETETTKMRKTARSIRMDRPVVKLAVAAAIVGAVVLGLFEFGGGDGTSGVVWAEVARRVEASGGVIARKRHSRTGAGLTKPIEWEARYYSSPQIGERQESSTGGEANVTCITKIEEQKMLLLMHPSKEYTFLDLTVENMAVIAEKQAAGMDPKGMVQQLLSGEYRKIGRKVIDGAKTEGVEIQNPPGASANFEVDSCVMRLWVNVETGYPVRMEMETVGENEAVRITLIVDQFEWHVALNPELFELEIPSGYTEFEGTIS